MPGIDHLKDSELWSESVYLDCVSPDGLTGFVVRVCRYPTEATGWLWVHVFTPAGLYAYTDHYVPCEPVRTNVDEADVDYTLGQDSPVSMRRIGPREAPASCALAVSVTAHADGNAGHGDGSHPVSLNATFRPLSASGTRVPGRIELLGEVQGEATVDGQVIPMRGLGQWHEQHQERPRFLRPFTYVTLRGERLAFVLTRGPLRAAGYARRNGAVIPITGFDIDPRGASRRLRLELEDGSILECEARTTHDYSVPIYDMRRPGTVVVAEVGGQRLSGCINDHLR